ncbi:MAG: NAD-dependent epimerase/dehydratase family protein, partial [Acidobacteria bacterium]|nr:NAD-dependent epimerase/dehydratase family protein [Acidobacteriota bacterium]
MKALVTGATGFIGGHLVEALIPRRDEAFVLIRPGGRGAGSLPPAAALVRG